MRDANQALKRDKEKKIPHRKGGGQNKEGGTIHDEAKKHTRYCSVAEERKKKFLKPPFRSLSCGIISVNDQFKGEREHCCRDEMKTREQA
jgi:hypothetical protein